MSRTWVAFFVSSIVWFPLGLVVGMLFMRVLARIAKERAWQEGRLEGLEAGKRIGREALFCAFEADLRRKVVQDVIADDSAAAFSEPVEPAA
jgi:hypothetical protein